MPDRLCSEARSFFCTGDNLSTQKHQSPYLKSIQVDISSLCCAAACWEGYAQRVTNQNITGDGQRTQSCQVTFVRARARRPRLLPACRERKGPTALLVAFRPSPCLKQSTIMLKSSLCASHAWSPEFCTRPLQYPNQARYAAHIPEHQAVLLPQPSFQLCCWYCCPLRT